MTDQGSEDAATTNAPTPPVTPPAPVYQQPPAYQPPAGYPPQAPYQQPAPTQPGWAQPPAAGPAWGQPQPPQQGGPGWGQPQPPAGPAWGQPQQPPPGSPAWGQPPAAPAWSQPQPQYWGNAVVESAGPKGTNILAILAGIVLLLVGLIPTLVGIIIIVGGAAVNSANQINLGGQFYDVSSFAGAIIVVGVVFLVIGLLQIVSGIFIWAHHSWARFLGIAFGLLGTLLGLGLLGSAHDADSSADAMTAALVVLVPYAYVLIALIIGGGQFRRKRA